MVLFMKFMCFYFPQTASIRILHRFATRIMNGREQLYNNNSQKYVTKGREIKCVNGLKLRINFEQG